VRRPPDRASSHAMSDGAAHYGSGHDERLAEDPCPIQQLAHRLVKVNPLYRIRQKRCDAKDFDLRQLLVRRQRDAVGDDDLSKRLRRADARWPARRGRRAWTGVDLAGPVVLGDVAAPTTLPARGDHIVEDHRHSAVSEAPMRFACLVSVALERRLSTTAIEPPNFFWCTKARLMLPSSGPIR